MPKLLLTWLALIGLTISAQAQTTMPLAGAGLGAPAGASGLTYAATAVQTSGSISTVNSYKFTAVPIGTPAANRVIAVFVMRNANYVSAITSITVGAVSLTNVSTNAANWDLSLWYGVVADGNSTDDITINWTNNNYGVVIDIAVAAIYTSTAAPTSNNLTYINNAGGSGTSYPASGPITVPTGGVAFGFCDDGTIHAVNWSNMTPDITGGTGFGHGDFGHKTAAGAFTPTFTADGYTLGAIVSATWGP